MAADVSARVHLVAEKLQQKAQDAQRKGNENAARALSASVSDLRQAMALISEQRHLLTRRRGEGDEEEDDADAHVQELATRLARVEAMLGKKSDDMKSKGNENAAAALQQSAATVDKGRSLLIEQQQTIFGLLGRWEKLEDVVSGKRRRRRSSVATNDGEEEEDQEVDTPQGRLIAQVRHLVQLGAVVKELLPECQEVEKVKEEMEKLKEEEEEVEKLRKELKRAEEDALEAQEMLKQESLALEEVKQEMQRMKEKEVQRQEEDDALLEQQREACQAMEQLVREGDQEIQRMAQSATTQAEEMQSLRIEIESLVSEKERLVRTHAEEIEELQAQLASAMDALSSKADDGVKSNDGELQALQVQLETLLLEKNAHADEVEKLRLQLEDAKASLGAMAKENALPNDEDLQLLQSKIDALTSEKENLIKLHEAEREELHVVHTQEIEDLRQQLDNNLNDRVEREELSSIGAEELQLLQNKLDALTDEKEGLLQLHADELEELKLAHSQEIEELKQTHSQETQELRQRLESAVSKLSTEEEGVGIVTELQSLQAKVDSLISEKEALMKAHLDEMEGLTSATDDLQSLRDEVSALVSEKDHLESAHANELEKLRDEHLAEIENLHQQFADLSSNTEEESASHADELQQLRAEVGALTIEKDHLVKEHAVEIEKLHHQVEDVGSDSECEAGDQVESGAGGIGENGVPVMELEEDQCSDISAEDEVDASSNGDEASVSKKESEMQALDDLRSQLAGYKENSQTQQDKICKLEQEQADFQVKIDILTSDKVRAVEELQSAHEAEVLGLQATLDTLEAQVAEYEERYQAQQTTITSLENEQVELQKRIDLLTNEKAHAVDRLQNSHEEETARLAQCVTDSEGTIESLSEQLEELKTALAEKSSEQSETAESLERCEAELRSSRMELDAQVLECSKLKNDLEATQDAQNAKSGEVELCLSELAAELDEITRKMDIEAMQELMGKVWQSQEVSELCSSLAPVVTELISTRDQLHQTEEQLELTRKERDNQKLILEQFVETADKRLFAKVDEEGGDIMEALASEGDIREYLAVAQANVARWLEELQQLHDRIEEDTAKLSEVNREKLQAQQRLVALEDSKRDLKVLVESLKEQLAAMRSEKEEIKKTAEKLKAQSHSASIQEQQQQTARQEEVADLQQQLASVRGDFERYRTRSHTALKKMEKRAELLNGMRKENEALLQQVKESNEYRDQAEAARQDCEARLLEVQRTQEMMQADFDEFAMEKARVIAELEEERQEREQTHAKIDKLRFKIQQLEVEKKQIRDESERIQEAEQAAFQARLSTATTAVQTAKQDLQKVHDALEASKAEDDKRKRLIESLELKLEEQSNPVTSDSNRTPPAPPILPVSTPVVASGLEKELSTLRESETMLKRQLDDARAELIGLQERFATTKAANAEKVFALEEQATHWKMELAAATEEVRRLNSVLQTQKSSGQKTQTSGDVSTASAVSKCDEVAESSVEQEELPSPTRVQELSEEARMLKAELQDANTEISLLSRALDASREELQEARGQIDALAPSLSEPESGEDSSGMSKAAKVLAAKDEALKKLRVQVLELQEELQTVREEKSALELELEKEELDDLQTSRKHIQSEKERTMQLQRRQTLVSSFEKQVTTIVDELQQRLEDHSTAFREVCDFRDDHRAALFDQGETQGKTSDEPEFEECLVMRSGVVIKAGASFQLPVICEKAGWRVVWNFSVKEDAADVSFKLSAMAPTEVEVVSPERMNEMSGVFQVRQDNTTLVFEWDNSFSWLNEKTLDYHVSIQEPLTVQAQKVRRSERELENKAKLLEDGLALIQVENQRRSELAATLKRLSAFEVTKEKHLTEFEARKAEVLEHKTRFQEEMDVQKAAFAAMLREQDELEDVERSITRAWASAVAEREDVEMTLQLAGNGAQLETLAHEMEEQAKVVAQQLKDPKPVEDSGDVEADASVDTEMLTEEEQQQSGQER